MTGTHYLLAPACRNRRYAHISRGRMLKIQLPYRAISTNKLYLGAKVVSPEYKRFKRDIGLYLVANYPKPVDLKGNLVMTLEVGLSSSLADGSNTVKGIEDSLAEHFKFNDKQIVTTHIEKYLKLIERVEKVNPEAASHLRNPAGFSKDCDFNYSGIIETAFIWGDTEQGHTYWSNISRHLEG